MRRVIASLVCVFAAVLAAQAATGTVVRRTVRVPRVVGMFVGQDYALLRQDGLRVTIPRGFEVNSLTGGGEVLSSAPPAGRPAAVGGTVSLAVGCRACALASPAVPAPLPAYRVPDFRAAPLSAVRRWITHKSLYLTEHFGPLRAATAPQLVDEYRVARQDPAPGATLRLGIGHRTGPNSGSFSPTPLSVWLVQRAASRSKGAQSPERRQSG